ncbi:hypothetical protein ACPA9J_28120 [Pseudomonas aeruginosa]
MYDLSVPIFIHGKHSGRPAPRLPAGGRGAGRAAAPTAQGLSLALNG